MALSETEELELLELEEMEASGGQAPTAPPPVQSQPSIFSRAKDAYDQYAKTQFGSPQDLLGRADSTIRQGFGKAGEMVTEQMGREGANPYLSAGVGTVISMAPDVASMAMPTPATKGAKPLFRSISQPMAQKSLGFTKRFLNTPFARGKAAQASEVALENNIIPFSGNPTEALARSVDLQKASGESLGAMRESAGTSTLEPVFDSLEAARQRATNGMRGGAWDTVHKKFDEAQETVMALLDQGPEVSLKSVEQAKKLLGKTVNWIADNVSQESAKQISNAIEGGVESIMKSKGIDMAAYEAQKRVYGASKMMQKGLANEVSAQAGNNAASLPSMVMGAGQLATGNVPGAAATIGITEALRRRGAGVGARLFEEAGRRLPPKGLLKAPIAARSLFSTEKPLDSVEVPIKHVFQPKEGTKEIPRSGNSQVRQPDNQLNKKKNQQNGASNNEGVINQGVLTESKAREYLKKADGDKVKAREMAKKDGWIVP